MKHKKKLKKFTQICQNKFSRWYAKRPIHSQKENTGQEDKKKSKKLGSTENSEILIILKLQNLLNETGIKKMM